MSALILAALVAACIAVVLHGDLERTEAQHRTRARLDDLRRRLTHSHANTGDTNA